MCGLAGIIGPFATRERIGRMAEALNHRGPDGKGFFIQGNVALGHTRLSIIDLSSNGNQPMTSQDGRYIICYNGEVYNFKELRNLYLKGQEFHSETDTETILYLYCRIGKKFVTLLRGMFAFTIYDSLKGTLFGARDIMGIKPFLYYNEGKNFVYASEIKSLLASGLVKFEIEPIALKNLFLYGSIQGGHTILKSVFSLPPASIFTLENGELKIESYWTFPSVTNFEISFEDAVSEYKKIFEESVKLQMVSDRTVGVFLSGGIDSSSILAALSNIGVTNIRTYTIGFEEKHKRYYNECEKAAYNANWYGLKNEAIYLNKTDIKPILNDFIFSLDQPSIDGLNTYLVSRACKNHLTVALSGLGGDELLMGYPRNINLLNMVKRKIHLPGVWYDNLLKTGSDLNSIPGRLVSTIFKRYGSSKNLYLHYWSSRLINNPKDVDAVLLKGAEGNINCEIDSFFEFSKDYISNEYNLISSFEVRSYMMNQLLRDMDAVSMGSSIEVRYPIIDNKLVEFLFSLPDSFKYQVKDKGTNHMTGRGSYLSTGSKIILQQAYKNNWPNGLLSGPKQGFQLPVYEWLFSSLREELPDLLAIKGPLSNFISPKALLHAQEKANNYKIDTNLYLMAIISKWIKITGDSIKKI